MSKGITSTAGFMRTIFKFHHDDDEEFFYRGHARKDYLINPSINRNAKLISAEHKMFRELIASNPVDFLDDKSTFEKLVRMQHYSMPTRLIDLTTNPLIALYFSCRSHPDRTSEVILFRIKKEKIKFFDSDTVSCLANLARLPEEDKIKIDLSLNINDFNDQPSIKKLLHFIKEEKSFFQEKINPNDMKKIICVKGRMMNNRMISQSGAFLLFGLGNEPFISNDEMKIEIISINSKSKGEIMKNLDSLNINDSTVFPYIDNSAKYISDKYK